MNCITKDIKNKSGIYKITNLNNQKCYIGQSINLEKRYRSHRNMLRSNTHHNNHLQHAYNKGDKFVFEVIELCSVEELDEREIMWIAFFDCRNDENGYNFDIGGNVTRDRHPETIEKQRESLKKYFSDETKRIELSKKKTTVDLSVVAKIKDELRFTDKPQTEIAKEFNVSEHIVRHICNLRSHSYIKSEHNAYLINRVTNGNLVRYNRNNSRKGKQLKLSNESIRKNKQIIRMYREGYSYQEIGKDINIHHRNVIARVNEIKTEHDDRCRLNSINKSILKRDSLIRTLYNMGKNTVEISKLLKVSRDTVSKVLNNKTKTFTEVSETRGKFHFKYKDKALA